jgi:hypothetical protein
MNPAEAVQAHLDFEASESDGMHFGTFQARPFTKRTDHLLWGAVTSCTPYRGTARALTRDPPPPIIHARGSYLSPCACSGEPRGPRVS